jgi:quinol---cytochrome c reductase iron-sulfur subunit, bacillus type
MDDRDSGPAAEAKIEVAAAALTRRTFLAWATAGVGAAIAAVLGATGLSYFVSPALMKDEENWIDVGAADSVPRGTPVRIDFALRRRDAWVVDETRSSAWVETPDGRTFTVFDPHCTHLGCPYRWDLDQKKFLCPCHGGVFNAAGQVVAGPPPRPLDHYPAQVVNGRLLIRMVPERTRAVRA